MARIDFKQHISIMSRSGRQTLSRVVDLVHVKLGNKAFIELANTPLEGADVFFWKYLRFEMKEEIDFVAQLATIEALLKELPNHPDIKIFLS